MATKFNNYVTYMTNGIDTLQSIVKNTQCNIKELCTLNKDNENINFNLETYAIYNKPLPPNVELKIPVPNVSAKTITYATVKEGDVSKINKIRSTSNGGNSWFVNRFAVEGKRNAEMKDREHELTHSGRRTGFVGGSYVDNFNYPYDFKKTTAFVIIRHGGERTFTDNIPFPTNFSDSNGASFTPTSPFGRSVDYQTYNSSSRTLSFDLEFHEDMYYHPDQMHKVVSELQSACYPKYKGELVLPPVATFTFGNHFKIQGIIENVGTSWDGPMGLGGRSFGFGDRISHCKVSITVKETAGPYDEADVRRPFDTGHGAGWRNV